MKTIGEILTQTRTDQGISLATVSARTKIQVKYLLALEKNDFTQLPAAAFVKGFIRNYALLIGKNPEALLAIFRRDYDQDKTGQVIPRLSALPPPRFWRITPPVTLAAVAALLVTLFLGYAGFQLRLLSRSPQLTLTTPSQDQTLTQTNIEVSGQTDPDATLTINHKPVILTPTGKFTDTVLLPPGTHTVTITATARNGKTTTLQRTITISE